MHPSDSYSSSTESSIPFKKQRLDVHKTTDMKSRACDDCRRKKTACYYLDKTDSACFPCQRDQIECTFNVKVVNTVSPLKSLEKMKKKLSGMEDYSQLPGRSPLKKTMSLQLTKSTYTVGETGLFDKLLLSRVDAPPDKTGKVPLSSNLALRKVSPTEYFILRTESDQLINNVESEEIEKLVYPHGDELLKLFFLKIQSSLPLLQTDVLLEKLKRTNKEILPALLGSIYLLGSQWWYSSDELCTYMKPDNLESQLYNRSLANFFKSSGSPTISLVQSGLFLLQSKFNDSRKSSIIAVVNTCAFKLSLHLDSSNWKLPKWEILLRQRLAWAVYNANVWISLFENCPNQATTFQLPELSDKLAANEDCDFDLFCALGTLTPIVQNISDLYLPHETPMFMIEHVLQLIKPIQIQLKQWFTSLSPKLIDLQTGNFSLRVAYLAAEISLHRFIIKTVIHTPNKQPEMLRVVRQSACERLLMALKSTKVLQPNHFKQIWQPESADQLALVGVFAALMAITSQPEEKSKYEDILQEFKTELEKHISHDVIKSTLVKLNSAIAGVF